MLNLSLFKIILNSQRNVFCSLHRRSPCGRSEIWISKYSTWQSAFHYCSPCVKGATYCKWQTCCESVTCFAKSNVSTVEFTVKPTVLALTGKWRWVKSSSCTTWESTNRCRSVKTGCRRDSRPLIPGARVVLWPQIRGGCGPRSWLSLRLRTSVTQWRLQRQQQQGSPDPIWV